MPIDPFTGSRPPNLTPDGRTNDWQLEMLAGIPLGYDVGQFDRFATGSVIQAALARQQLNEALGKQKELYANVEAPLRDQLARVRGTDLAGEFASTSLASTQSAQASALTAARAAGGSGGFSRGLAVRAATGAAGAQSASISDAILRGTMSKLDMENNLTSQLTQVGIGKANTLSALEGANAQFSFDLARLLSGLASPGSQIEGAEIGANSAIRQTWINQLGQLHNSSSGGGGTGGVISSLLGG